MMARGSIVLRVRADGSVLASVRWQDGAMRRYRFDDWGECVRSFLPWGNRGYSWRVRVQTIGTLAVRRAGGVTV